MKPAKDMELAKGISAKDLVEKMYESGGFTAKHLGTASHILKSMMQEDCTNFLSFPACIVATGTRGVLKDMIKNKMFQAVMTTCGTLDHDIARSFKDYYHGSFDSNDAELHKKNVNRLGNIFVPNESYGEILESFMQPILEELYKEKKEWSTRDLVWAFGERLKEDSILYWAAKHKIPVFVPGITDGAFGSQLWFFQQDHKDFRINLFEDEFELSEIVFAAKKTGALLVGGGISKHHTIWWNQFRDGLDYAVGITTATEYDGSLSGARVKEAVSWGKVREDANYVTVNGDATVLLPLLYASLI